MIPRLIFHPSQVEQSHTPIPASKGSKYSHPAGIMVNEEFVDPLHADKLVSGGMEEEAANPQGMVPDLSYASSFIAALIRQSWRASKLCAALC